MQPEPVFDEPTVRAAAPASRTLSDRGVSVLSLGVPSGAEDATDDYADDFSDVRYREPPALPLKLMLFDRVEPPKHDGGQARERGTRPSRSRWSARWPGPVSWRPTPVPARPPANGRYAESNSRYPRT